MSEFVEVYEIDSRQVSSEEHQKDNKDESHQNSIVSERNVSFDRSFSFGELQPLNKQNKENIAATNLNEGEVKK